MTFRLPAVLAGVIVFVALAGPASCLEQGPAAEIGIDEKLGSVVPLDLSFADEEGLPLHLRDLVTKPTVLVFVYFTCNHTCPALLSGLSETLSKTELSPGRDFNVIAVSFDERDTPAMAGEKKKIYLRLAGRDFPGRSWSFLTGSAEAVAKLTTAAGFKFRRTETGFAHPVGLIVLSPQGKITRYLYGITFLPMDFTLAITEASKGLAVPTVRKLLLYCYTYDPEGRRYVFNILKVAGGATIFFILVFIGWLTRWGRKGRRQA